MHKLILLAGAAAMTAAMPAYAKPGHGKDRGAVKSKTHKAQGAKHSRHACPPGLAKKTPRCIPPGQAKHMWKQGQRLPASYRDYLAYDALLGRLPESYRDDIPVGDYRYIYRDNSVYVVNPRTRLIERIIDIIF